MAQPGVERVPRSDIRDATSARAETAPATSRCATPPDDGATEEEKWALVERIIHNPALSGSQALQAFLRYVTRHAIAGTSERIKEQRIGCEVLGRKPDYDTAQDNIVRVRAHELRQRLARYFETTAETEPIVITIPRGSYVPIFHLRNRQTRADQREPAASVPPPPTHWRWFSTKWLGWLTALILGSLLVANILSNPKRQSSGPKFVETTGSVRDFWSQLFSANQQEVLVVAADSTFALWQDLTGKTLNLGQYLGRKSLLLDSPDSKMRELAARRLTSAADLNIATRLAEFGAAFGGRVRAEYARNLNAQELQTNTAVLIGSRRSNPWVELFEPQMNFILTQDSNSGAPAFLNRNPNPGEASRFSIPHMLDSDGTEQKEMNAYAHIAFLSNQSSGGNVLILEGLNMEGTEAAGEFVMNKEALVGLLQRCGHRDGRPIKPFEALLNLTSVPGGFANTRVVAYRSKQR